MNTWLFLPLMLFSIRPSTTTNVTDKLDKEQTQTEIDVLLATEHPVTHQAVREHPSGSLTPGEALVTGTPPSLAESPRPSLAESPRPSLAESPRPSLAESPRPELLHPVAAVPSCQKAQAPEGLQLLGEAISKFGLELFKEILQETSKPNVIISPLSIALGLAQLSLGAVNETEKQIQRSLHLLSLNCSHCTLCSSVESFRKSVLTVASSIYIQKGTHINPEFIKDSMRFYSSEPQLLTGINAKDTNAINSWVQEKTGGKIKTFFNEVPRNIVLLLLNAIHFKGLWQVQFDPLATASDVFYKEDGSSVQVAMMQHPKYPLRSFHDDDLQIEVARLSFKQNMSLIVVKPMGTGKLDSVVSRLNISDLLAHNFKTRPMPLQIPKLNINFDVELNKALKNLGLGKLFSNPDLRRISPMPLIVSSIQHKAMMELKEEGVQAAASTGIAVNRSFMKCTINRPFFFIIRDDISGIPIFLGTIKDPKPHFQAGTQEKLVVNLERMRKVKETMNPK
ncbi:serpin peptidase inhibitor, clade F (alpha-2 antiplasmin, pigment epithelium derived factor), member 2b [Hemiscyllium ocellatum]|uniref:serpin peptidase inhibitor, clade F (alpha-2 antiplasmin, pigment epithelium derived factor), member 2b n=1 Tax=Hemiscyllium ocellatum TaxID=170820 RepID=UPI002966A042|nr:serpin peptidase inhibitor, clade F (alpha-2 antiplasmin, pigment epithelium derived factor), member 2b [Hemiscyllium ocellatum]